MSLRVRERCYIFGPGDRGCGEFGTFGGYSTIWLARSLPHDGRVITLEIDPKHAEVAKTNLAPAGVANRVELHLGKALDTLPKLADAQQFYVLPSLRTASESDAI